MAGVLALAGVGAGVAEVGNQFVVVVAVIIVLVVVVVTVAVLVRGVCSRRSIMVALATANSSAMYDVLRAFTEVKF